MFDPVNWADVLAPSYPLLELIVRGSLTYLGTFLLVRIVFQRESGSVKMSNLLVVVLLGDAIQNGMSGHYASLTDGLLLIAIIAFWAYFLDWLGYRVPAVQRLIHPAPLLLVKDGHMLRRNMRQELITIDELMEVVRQQGLEDVQQVRRAWMEGDGRFSVIPFERRANAANAQHEPPHQR